MRNNARKLVYALAIVLAWFGFVIEGTHALFIDSASLTGNTITSGSIDLLVSNSQAASSTTYAETRPGFSFELSPGKSEETYFLLKNASSSELDLNINALAMMQAPTNSEIINGVSLEFVAVDGTGAITGAPVSATLATLSSQKDLGVIIPKGVQQRFKMKASMNQNVVTTNQSQSYDLVFTGVQKVN